MRRITSSRFAGWAVVNSTKRRSAGGCSAVLQSGSDLLEHAKRVGYSAQCGSIQKGSRGQFIAARLESPEAREQIAAVHGRDIAWMQRLQRVQIVPIKEMTFETLELIHCFERAEVARHQIVDCDVAKIIGRHGRQHPEPDIRR